MIDYTKYKLSLKRLEEQHDNYKRNDPAISDLYRDAVAESVIQRFETCYDCMWKLLKRYLIENLGISDPPNSPKPVLRIANENMPLPATIEQWLVYANARTNTSHDYDGEKARKCLELMPDFIGDAIELYESMSGNKWQ